MGVHPSDFRRGRVPPCGQTHKRLRMCGARVLLAPRHGRSEECAEMRDEAATLERSAHEPRERALPSKGLAVACVLHAAPLYGAAFTLPWEMTSWFTLVVGALATLHAAVAVAALLRRPRALVLAWRILTVYSLTLLALITGLVGTTALYLIELYRSIGSAISVGLFGIWALFVLFTVPISIWAISRVGLLRRVASRRLTQAAVVVGGGAVLCLWLVARTARADVVEGASSAPIVAVARSWSAHRGAGERSLFHAEASECAQPVSEERLTLLVTSLNADGEPLGACLQEASAAALAKQLETWLAARAARGAPLKLDLVRAVHAMSRSHAVIDALKVRPALDGVCARQRCLAPWQLVAADAFTKYRPLKAVKDASFGCSFDDLAQRLGSPTPEHEQLVRIETESLLVRGGSATPLRRLRPREMTDDPATLATAVERAERHIQRALQADGSFRYLLDPFSGKTDDATMNLPRQAGTVLVLCELGGKRSNRAAAAALEALAGHEQRLGERSALSTSHTRAQLGHTALPLIALASCRPRVGTQHDPLIGRLARLLITIQREDGAFYPELDLRRGKASGLHTPLYAAGQGVFALVLVQALARENPDGPFPPEGVVREAVERAMHHYARDYWPRALRSMFFLEENWHCLAARAALPIHRNDEYEQFCLDYVAFKSRLILRRTEHPDLEHVGGYSLSNMLPPHSTATAGFGEALAAAIAVKRARGADVGAERTLMKEVLGFVLRQQWTAETCFACAGPDVFGGFSETSASPSIRIDFVQHAMAALGHGLASLGESSAGL